MKRRAFLNSALAGAAGVALVSGTAQAASASEWDNVIFTQDDPGHWKDVEKLHVPVLSIEGNTLTVTTPHPMSEAHYIVSHTVILERGRFLGRQTFTWKDKPVSTHTLPAGYKGKIIVTSTCNRHDWWLKEHHV
jgi:superoxide reductase